MKNVLLVLVTILFASCSSRNDVVRSGFLQKRKYKKGYNLSFKKKQKENKGKQVIVKKEDVKYNKLALKDSSEIVNVTSNEEVQEVLEASIDEGFKLGVYSLLEKIEKNTSLKVLDTKKKRQKLEKLLEEGEVAKSYANYNWLLVLGILSSFLIFGIFILIRMKKVGKEEINKSKALRIRPKLTLFLYLLGVLMLAAVVYFLNLSSQSDYSIPNEFIYAALIGLLGIVVFIFGMISIGFLFRELNKLNAIAKMPPEERAIYEAKIRKEKEEKRIEEKKREKLIEDRRLEKEAIKKKKIADAQAIEDAKSEEEKAQDKVDEDTEKSKKSFRTRLLANCFTWATFVFPLFVFPAILFNIMVIRQEKESENKRKKILAIVRLAILPLAFLVGIGVTLGVLESLGVITSTSA